MNESDLIAVITQAILENDGRPDWGSFLRAECSEPLLERRNAVLKKMIDLIGTAFELHCEILEEQELRKGPVN